jgi:hypothetical protein
MRDAAEPLRWVVTRLARIQAVQDAHTLRLDTTVEDIQTVRKDHTPRLERLEHRLDGSSHVGRRRALHDPLHDVQADHLEIERVGRRQLGVDGNQAVDARNLKTVAGIEEHPDVAPGEGRSEVASQAIHAGLVEVEA